MLEFYISLRELKNSNKIQEKIREKQGYEDYSIIRDLKKDGLRFSGTVWVKSDDGQKKEKTGTTTAVGKTGQVRVSKASTHQHPTVKEKTGYKNIIVVKAEK